MEFDKNRVYTAVNAEELKVGSKVIVADNLKFLKEKVAFGPVPDELTKVLDESNEYRFVVDKNHCALAYLVEEPAKLKWTDLRIGDIIRHGENVAMVTQIDFNGTCGMHIYAGEWIRDRNELEEWEKIEK